MERSISGPTPAPPSDGATALSVDWAPAPDGAGLEIAGWTSRELAALRALNPEDRRRHISIRPVALRPAAAEAAPAMAGRFEVAETTVVFRPRFPFTEGASYRVRVERPLGRGGTRYQTGVEVLTINRPRRVPESTVRVTGIFPSGPAVPVNLLRVYVHFSGPMSDGYAARHVRLQGGNPVRPLSGALAPLTPELWDGSRQRLTLLLDPARIKRGLAPNLQAGYPLDEGDQVTVVVDADYPDAGGAPLGEGAERRYLVGPAERRRVDPGRWRVTAPRAGTHQPLLVTLDRSLDCALLARLLRVAGPDGSTVRGRSEVGGAELSWKLMPDDPWVPGPHRLVVDGRLEDVAGNSVVRVFDRDLDRPQEDPLDVTTATVGFVCLPAG